MRTASVVFLLALAGPALAEGNGAPAPDPDQKPYILDAPPRGGSGLKDFQAPTPVSVIVPGDPVPKVGPTPAPATPAPKSREETAPPKPAPKGFG
jgi:hypothetical protein